MASIRKISAHISVTSSRCWYSLFLSRAMTSVWLPKCVWWRSLQRTAVLPCCTLSPPRGLLALSVNYLLQLRDQPCKLISTENSWPLKCFLKLISVGILRFSSRMTMNLNVWKCLVVTIWELVFRISLLSNCYFYFLEVESFKWEAKYSWWL